MSDINIEQIEKLLDDRINRIDDRINRIDKLLDNMSGKSHIFTSSMTEKERKLKFKKMIKDKL